jgi:hypothetical protein
LRDDEGQGGQCGKQNPSQHLITLIIDAGRTQTFERHAPHHVAAPLRSAGFSWVPNLNTR